jgi:hypothetical protein
VIDSDLKRKDGLCPLTPEVSHQVFYCIILAGVQEVRRDNKQRFSLLEEDGELLIRANQGHTVIVCSLPEISCTKMVHFPFNIFVRWKCFFAITSTGTMVSGPLSFYCLLLMLRN